MKTIISLLAFVLTIAPLSKIAAQSGSTLFEDHFVENDRGWNLGDDKNVIRKIEDGKLILECRKYLQPDGGGYWIKAPDFTLPPSNYSISVTTRWLKNMKTDDRYSPYGLIIGDYYFLIYGDGNRRLLHYNTTDKKYEVIVDWGENAAIHKKGSGDNKLEIQYKDGKAAFYVNGQMLYKKDAVIEPEMTVKLYIENSEVVSYDDLIVKAL